MARLFGLHCRAEASGRHADRVIWQMAHTWIRQVVLHDMFGKIHHNSAGGSGKPLSSQLLGRPMCLDLSASQGAPCQLVGWRVHINMGVGLCSALKRGAAANNLRGTV